MKIRIAIGLVLSLFFIYLSFWSPNFAALGQGEGFLKAFFGYTRIDLSELGQVLAEARYGWLLAAVGLLILSLFSRAQRWRILLRPVDPQIHYWPVYSAMNIGYMINNILPLRMGEVLRAYFLGKSEHMSKSSILATIVVERIIDILVSLSLLGITIFFFPFPDWIRNGLFYVGGGVLLLIVFLIGLLVNTQRTINILRTILKPLPQKATDSILKIVSSFASGLEVMRTSRHYFAIFVHSVFLIACYILSVYCTLLAFDLVSPQYPAILSNPFLASVVLLIIMTIGIGLPSAPGAVGTFHGIVAFGVSLFAVPAESAMGLAIAIHLANYIPLTTLGLICFWGQHFKFSEVKEQFSGEKAD